MKMPKIRITQTRSAINRPDRQRLTLQALGLGKLHRSIEVEGTQQILGMIAKVDHLVSTENL